MIPGGQGEICVADAASTGLIPPNEAVQIATDELHALEGLSLEIGEAGRFVGERDVVGPRGIKSCAQDCEEQDSLHDFNVTLREGFCKRDCERMSVKLVECNDGCSNSQTTFQSNCQCSWPLRNGSCREACKVFHIR
jgi:hypothetical protein